MVPTNIIDLWVGTIQLYTNTECESVVLVLILIKAWLGKTLYIDVIDFQCRRPRGDRKNDCKYIARASVESSKTNAKSFLYTLHTSISVQIQTSA